MPGKHSESNILLTDSPNARRTFDSVRGRKCLVLRNAFITYETVAIGAKKMHQDETYVDLPPRQSARWEAAADIWGTDGIPPGISRRDLDSIIRRWLHVHGRSNVGSTTIRRALERFPRRRLVRIRRIGTDAA
jgi:hypothetical protein